MITAVFSRMPGVRAITMVTSTAAVAAVVVRSVPPRRTPDSDPSQPRLRRRSLTAVDCSPAASNEE